MAAQYSVKKYQISSYKPSVYVSRLLPYDISHEYEIIPLQLKDNRLLVASAYPLTRQDINSIQKEIRYPLDVIQAGIMEIRSLRSELYREESDRYDLVPQELALTGTGLIGEEQLASLKAAQVDSGKNLVDLALEKNWITTEQWGEVMGLCFHLPHIRPQTAGPVEGIDALIPYAQSELLGVVPLWWVRNTLYVAVSNEKVMGTLQDLRKLLFNTRAVICDENIFRFIQKSVYKPKYSQDLKVSDREIAELIVRTNVINADELEIAFEIQHRTDLALSSILAKEFGIPADVWLDAEAESLGLVAIHEDDLPADIHERIRDLLPLIPVSLLLEFNLLPLFLEEDILVLAMPEVQTELIALISAITGCQIEARLMDKTLLKKMLDSFKDELSGSTDEFDRQFEVMNLDEFLSYSGLIQRDQLERLDSDGVSEYIDLSEQLLKENLLNERELAEIYSLISGIPWLTLEYFQFDTDLVEMLPADMALENRVFPLFENSGDLWVAVSDLRSCDFLNEVEELTQRRVWPLIVPRTALLAALNRFYLQGEHYSSADEAFEIAGLLVKGGLITQAESFSVVTATVDDHLPFDQAVMDLGHVAPHEFYQYLADKLKTEYLNVDMVESIEESYTPLGELQVYRHWQESIDVNAARLLDLMTAKRMCAIPVARTEQGLQVAFADPLYKGKVQEIEVLVNQKVIPCLAGREAIHAAVERILGQVNLGTSLLMAGRITLSQLNDALTLAENTNIRIGRALVHRGYITEQALYRFLAHQARLPLFDLTSADLDVEAAHLIEEEQERRLGILPLAADDDNVFLAMVDPLNQEGITLAQEVTGKKVTPILVAERNFDLVMEKLYQDDYLARSVSQLLTRSPEDSAFRVFSRGQIITMVIVALVSIAWLIWNYTSYLIVVNSLVSIFYLVFSGYKAIITSKALKTDLEVELTQEDIDELVDRDLPVYTILVPVYKEANVLPQILKCLSDLDYPKTKLDIKILMEANDQETIDAFYNADPPDFIHDIIVPDAQPKTKPKACNYGLIHARGEFLVIYDAEDLPERDQLKRSVVAFRKVPADVVCIQAKLNYHNRTQNILTQWFTSEYSMWFDLLLPGLDASRAPIPLGGTSNHFKTFSLIEVGAWDPYNVTEDADLGIRLYKRGYRTRIMDSTTYEEANSEISNWIRQRSRWVKGYIQTWLVHMRHPLKMLRELGWRAFMSFQIMIGGTFLALLVNPIYWLMTTAWFLFEWDFIQILYPGFIFYVGAICLYVGNFIFTYANVAGAMRRKYYDMVRITLFSPLYWGLMSMGAWKGFIQLLIKPHFWEKTIHGLHDRNELEEQMGQET